MQAVQGSQLALSEVYVVHIYLLLACYSLLASAA